MKRIFWYSAKSVTVSKLDTKVGIFGIKYLFSGTAVKIVDVMAPLEEEHSCKHISLPLPSKAHIFYHKL
jgi:hypothetical protein